MARMWITDDTIKVGVAGKDPHTAVAPDDFLLNIDFLPDQVLLAGSLACRG